MVSVAGATAIEKGGVNMARVMKARVVLQEDDRLLIRTFNELKEVSHSCCTCVTATAYAPTVAYAPTTTYGTAAPLRSITTPSRALTTTTPLRTLSHGAHI